MLAVNYYVQRRRRQTACGSIYHYSLSLWQCCGKQNLRWMSGWEMRENEVFDGQTLLFPAILATIAILCFPPFSPHFYRRTAASGRRLLDDDDDND
jgi:hypothetical protein